MESIQNQSLVCPKCKSEQYYGTADIKPVSPPFIKHICLECGGSGYETNEYKTKTGRGMLGLMTNDELLAELKEYGFNFGLGTSIPYYKKLFKLLGIESDLNSDNFIEELRRVENLGGIAISFQFIVNGNQNFCMILKKLRDTFN